MTGAQLRSERNMGWGDDSAWNGLNVLFRPFRASASPFVVKGFWKKLASGPSIEYTITNSVKKTSSSSVSREFKLEIGLSVEAGVEASFDVGVASGGASLKTTASTTITKTST